MNIPKINLFNNNYRSGEVQKNNYVKFNNLAPMPYDTVSFGSKKEESVSDAKVATKISLDHSNRGSLNTATKLYHETEYAYGILKYALKHTLGVNVLDIPSQEDSFGGGGWSEIKKFEDSVSREMINNQGKPVAFVCARRKTPRSIAEKMGTTHPKITSKKAAKEQMDDLIGARIVLYGNSTAEGDYVLDKLTEAVKSGRLKITEVENHGQYNIPNYASKTKINKLVEAARKYGEPLCTYEDRPRDSGYLAIHITTGDIIDGINAEIQIMSYDVMEFKEIEDLCYKALHNKNVPKKYAEICKMFNPLKENKKLSEDFLEYTKRAYANERMKPLDKKIKKGHERFLKIPNDLNIPNELDFNNIAKIKYSIDEKEKRNKNQTKQKIELLA